MLGELLATDECVVVRPLRPCLVGACAACRREGRRLRYALYASSEPPGVFYPLERRCAARALRALARRRVGL